MFAEFETILRRASQLEGIADAKDAALQGTEGDIDPTKIRRMKAKGHGAPTIAKTLKIGRASAYRSLAE